MMSTVLLAIDQGTTSSRAILFDTTGNIISQHQIEFAQHFPQNGWVEHDANDIWDTTLEACRQAITKSNVPLQDIAGIGISNQRETTVLWDRKTGEPLYHAIVWQDRRTAKACAHLKEQGLEAAIREKTGLLLDPYFSASKLQWLLDNVPHAREKANQNQLAFGTIDTFLLWRFTNGKVHATDMTNASRTLLFNIKNKTWDEDLLDIFNIPKSLLPEVKDCNAQFGKTHAPLLGMEIPITGMAGDQQAAAVGQACFKVGDAKSTYGTGCFLLLNTGNTLVHSKHQLLSTIAYSINGEVTYGLEGSIFVAGAAIQWLRDKMHWVENVKETEALSASVNHTGGVYFVPAFTGLGAPYWDPHARGAIVGLTRDTEIAHIVRAALEAVCYQTRDLVQCLNQDSSHPLQTLRVDGGMAANNWLVQFLSDMLGVSVQRPHVIETSALGAAYLAGLGAGVYNSIEEIANHWQCQASFESKMPANENEALYQGWLDAVGRTVTSQRA